MKSDIPHMYSCPGKVLLPLCHHNDKCNSLASWHTSVHTAVLHIHLYLQRPAKKREENSYQIYLNMNYLVKKKKRAVLFCTIFHLPVLMCSISTDSTYSIPEYTRRDNNMHRYFWASIRSCNSHKFKKSQYSVSYRLVHALKITANSVCCSQIVKGSKTFFTEPWRSISGYFSNSFRACNNAIVFMSLPSQVFLCSSYL